MKFIPVWSMRSKSGTGKAARAEIWTEEISSRRKNRHRLRFHRRAFCRLRQHDHLRGLGGLRQTAENLSRRVRPRARVAGLGRCDERRGRPVIRRRKFKRPADLKDVEICSRPACSRPTNVTTRSRGPNGDVVQKRTTYMEIATDAQMPTEPCNVHGEPRPGLLRECRLPNFRALDSAADLSEVQTDRSQRRRRCWPKTIPTTRSRLPRRLRPRIKSGRHAKDRQSRKRQTTRADTRNQTIERCRSRCRKAPMLRAIPVEPKNREETPVEIRRAVAGWSDGRSRQGALLRATTPPPASLTTSDKNGGE